MSSRLALAGLVPGAVGGAALQRLLARELAAPDMAGDPLALTVGAALVGGAVVAACWFGARRALGLVPAEVLRGE